MPTASLQVAFEPAEPRLLIQLEAGFSFDGNIPFHVFPANPDIVRVTPVGAEYLATGNRQLAIEGEIVKFDKTSRAQLKYPGVVSAALIDIDAAFRTIDLSPISPRWSIDREAGAIIAQDPATNAPVSIIGGVAVDYSAEYSRYLYTPKSDALGAGTRNEFGHIIAIKGEAVETLEIDAELGTDNGFEEVYRVISTVIASNGDETPDRWEKPPGWPGDNSFPVSNDGPDPDSSFDDERVHEIGYINKIGLQRFERFRWKREKPYVGISSYYPVWTLEKTEPPEQYREAYLEIDWGKVLEEVGKRWPGVTNG